ncbi:hypothetical protein [Lentibacillus saliphilus]|uniref:hypothetical protein n=1 Tax=Lentibacillus saliphilus TaxID=2737028 RepID=UPI001C2FA467|nr:hypothetical protein [Lentibacillus saliphilus]
MEIIRAKEVEEAKIETLLNLNQALDKDLLIECGYVVNMSGKIAGCFVLDPIDTQEYWLRHLYLKPDAAYAVIVLLETAITLARQNDAAVIYVNSHQSTVNTLLEALHFKRSHMVPQITSEEATAGIWWTYHVS